MCLSINYGEKLNIAKKDLVCYKILQEGLISLYQDFKYKLNKTYKIFRWQKSKEEKNDLMRLNIYSGFHSYQTIEKKLWILQNPPIFERGEIAEVCYNPEAYKAELTKVEVLDDIPICWGENYSSYVSRVGGKKWIRKYYTRAVNGKLGEVREIDEDNLIKIVKTVPAKSIK